MKALQAFCRERLVRKLTDQASTGTTTSPATRLGETCFGAQGLALETAGLVSTSCVHVITSIPR